MIKIPITIGFILYLILCTTYAQESVTILTGTGDPGTSARIMITAEGENKAYTYVNKFIVEEGASIIAWHPDAVAGAEITGEGDVVYVGPEVNAILQFFDVSVETGALYGIGRGRSANNKLSVLRNMIIEAGNNVAGACEQLSDVYKKTDGLRKPPDFVSGEAAPMLADMIKDLRDDMRCDLSMPVTLANSNSESTEVELHSEVVTKSIPDEFGLAQNYPNPFNPDTKFNFQLPQDEYISIEIYDILGQHIRILANRKYEAGYYTLTWDGKDLKGNSLPSGVYIYRIQAGEFQDVKKMILLR